MVSAHHLQNIEEKVVFPFFPAESFVGLYPPGLNTHVVNLVGFSAFTILNQDLPPVGSGNLSQNMSLVARDVVSLTRDHSN